MIRSRLLWPCLLWSCLPAPPAARAQPAPPKLPARDVDVTYRIARPDAPAARERVRWRAADGLERIDGPGAVSIIDHRAGTTLVLSPKTRTTLTIEAPPDGGGGSGGITLEPGVGYARDGEGTVAGIACMRWRWIDPASNEPGAACVTEDGLVLEKTVGGRGAARATSVSYGKQDKALFRAPDGYEPALDPEGGMP